jgi:hypothetical protein
MLLIPFSSVLAVLSEGPATAHAASHKANSDVESHILAFRSLSLAQLERMENVAGDNKPEQFRNN